MQFRTRFFPTLAAPFLLAITVLSACGGGSSGGGSAPAPAPAPPTCTSTQRLIGGQCMNCNAPSRWNDGNTPPTCDAPPPTCTFAQRLVNNACTDCTAPRDWNDANNPPTCETPPPPICTSVQRFLGGQCINCAAPRKWNGNTCEIPPPPPTCTSAQRLIGDVCLDCPAPGRWSGLGFDTPECLIPSSHPCTTAQRFNEEERACTDCPGMWNDFVSPPVCEAPPAPLPGNAVWLTNIAPRTFGGFEFGIYPSRNIRDIAPGGYPTNETMLAQGFTTGPNVGGYILHNVTIPLYRAEDDGSSTEVGVRIWSGSAGGVPDSPLVARLTGPAPMGYVYPHYPFIFTAPADTVTLAANTTYFLVLNASRSKPTDYSALLSWDGYYDDNPEAELSNDNWNFSGSSLYLRNQVGTITMWFLHGPNSESPRLMFRIIATPVGSAPAGSANTSFTQHSTAVPLLPAHQPADLNSDGVINADDGMILYYAQTYPDFLGDGATGGSAPWRRTLLGALVQPQPGETPDAAYRRALRNANALTRQNATPPQNAAEDSSE